MKKMTSFATVLGALYLGVATMVANTASWVILHNEEVPNELKK